MNYGGFLALFLGVPLCLLAIYLRASIDRRVLGALIAISIVALVYTGPWDNLIIVNGVWSYGPGQIVGVVVGHVPLEEYIFYVLQVFLTGLLTLALSRRAGD